MLGMRYKLSLCTLGVEKSHFYLKRIQLDKLHTQQTNVLILQEMIIWNQSLANPSFSGSVLFVLHNLKNKRLTTFLGKKQLKIILLESYFKK